MRTIVKPQRKRGIRKKRHTETGKIRIESKSEMKKHHANLKEILTCSNATLFLEFNFRGYVCHYCDSQFSSPATLKQHTLDNHKGLNTYVIPKLNKNANRLDEFCMKLDITGLLCTLCETERGSLEDLMDHLEGDHKKDIHRDIKNQLLPFKFSSDTIQCCMCPSIFDKFRSLQQHMHTHYRNFICDECGIGYVIKGCLKRHLLSHIKGVFECNLCSKTFETKRKAQFHEFNVHTIKHMSKKCGYCNEKFTKTAKRDEHLMKVHGIEMKVLKCHACDRTFTNKNALRIHTRRDHLMERRFKCTQCDKDFFEAASLKFHMVTHTGAREFQCTVCFKLYSRKETLRQHMEIHSDVRRFKCEHCNRTFVQKASWKGHMRSRHDVLV